MCPTEYVPAPGMRSVANESQATEQSLVYRQRPLRTANHRHWRRNSTARWCRRPESNRHGPF